MSLLKLNNTQQKCIRMVTRKLNSNTVLKSQKLGTTQRHTAVEQISAVIFTQWNAVPQGEWIIYNYVQQMDDWCKPKSEQ